PRHLHHHRPHRLRRRAQHPHLAHHDGHGKNQRHRRAHVHGHQKAPDSPHLHRARHAHRRHRNPHRTRPRLRHLLGRRPLPFHLPLPRGLFHRLRPLRPPPNRRPD